MAEPEHLTVNTLTDASTDTLADSLAASEYTLRRLSDFVRRLSENDYGNVTLRRDGDDNDNLTPLETLRAMTVRARISHLRNNPDAKRVPPPASKSAMEALAKEVVEEENVECAVCMSNVGVGVLITKLPCGHGYHGDCIMPWLDKRNSCPVCRFELETDDADYEEARSRREAARTRGSVESGRSSSS